MSKASLRFFKKRTRQTWTEVRRIFQRLKPTPITGLPRDHLPVAHVACAIKAASRVLRWPVAAPSLERGPEAGHLLRPPTRDIWPPRLRFQKRKLGRAAASLPRDDYTPSRPEAGRDERQQESSWPIKRNGNLPREPEL